VPGGPSALVGISRRPDNGQRLLHCSNRLIYVAEVVQGDAQGMQGVRATNRILDQVAGGFQMVACGSQGWRRVRFVLEGSVVIRIELEA
jgi:hypothetical protein